MTSCQDRPRALVWFMAGFLPAPLLPNSQSRRQVLTLALAASLTASCAGHSAKTAEARNALDAGEPQRALSLYNDALGVGESGGLPEDSDGDNALLILDRSMVHQQLEHYDESSRDLQVADKRIEILDLEKTALDDIGKYMFSDDVGPYQAPPYEKLMINTMNMLNYLARQDLSGARIEARRFSIIEEYLQRNDQAAASMSAPGNYFAGFIFEKSGRPDIALRYYEAALEYGDFKSLVPPLRWLTRGTMPRGRRTRELLQKHSQPSATPPAESGPTPASLPSEGDEQGHDVADDEGAPVASEGTRPDAAGRTGTDDSKAFASLPAAPPELLIVINYGRVPAKVPKRIPIGLAMTYGSLYLSSGTTTQVNALAAQGLVTWVNYPELEEYTSTYTTPSVKVDGEYRVLEEALSVTEEARRAYDEIKGKIIAAAITRTVTRAVAGTAAGAAAGAATNEGAVGLLLSLGTQAALTAADTPDTRSWATLPGRIAVTRVQLPSGQHQVEVAAQGASRTFQVDLKPGGWDALVLTVLR